jgi:hypothetical protein
MGSTKVFKRTTLPFDTPIPIPKKSKELLVNSFGYVRAEMSGGVVIVQTKKLRGNQRELVRIDTNVSPPTIEFSLETAETMEIPGET